MASVPAWRLSVAARCWHSAVPMVASACQPEFLVCRAHGVLACRPSRRVSGEVLGDCMRTSAPRLIRLVKRFQFQAAAGDGRRFRSSEFNVQVLDRADDQDGIRIGLTASRKCGNSVKRSRIKRRLRAAAREAFAGIEACADVVAVARPETISAKYDDLVQTFKSALVRARPQRKSNDGAPRSVHPTPSIQSAAGQGSRPSLQKNEMIRS